MSSQKEPAKEAPLPRLPESPAETKEFSDLYPQRRGFMSVEYSTLQKAYGHNREQALKNVCHDNLIFALETYPMVRTLLGALESVGCPVELDRHFLCDSCKVGSNEFVNHGGYDEVANQVFVCANNTQKIGQVHAVLVRNLIAMFDRCMHKYDFRNPEHLACTEIRKANLAGCEYVNYLSRSDGTFYVQGAHADCVRKVAIESMVKAKFVPEDVAKAAVWKVFDRCYKDLEPIGRRARNKEDIELAHRERFLCNYH